MSLRFSSFSRARRAERVSSSPSTQTSAEIRTLVAHVVCKASICTHGSIVTVTNL